MINLKSIDIEYIICAAFGIIALIISLVIGAFSGNRAGLVFQRAFITAIIFTVIGFISIFIIKKYVPEVYQLITSGYDNEDLEIKAENPVNQDDKANISDEGAENKSELNNSTESEGSLKISREDTDLENEFTTLDKQSGEDYSLNAQQNNSNLFPKDAFKDKKIKYEPKIAAQAIRTMMKRDE